MAYPDHFNPAAFNASVEGVDDHESRDADIATLQTLALRVKALQEFVHAWTPCTYRGDDAHGHFTDMLDELKAKIGATIDEIQFGE